MNTKQKTAAKKAASNTTPSPRVTTVTGKVSMVVELDFEFKLDAESLQQLIEDQFGWLSDVTGDHVSDALKTSRFNSTGTRLNDAIMAQFSIVSPFKASSK